MRGTFVSFTFGLASKLTNGLPLKDILNIYVHKNKIIILSVCK